MQVLVIVPTYQEAENIERFLETTRAVLPAADILVVDDNSPDGTGKLAEAMAGDLGGITVLHRPGKEGLGAAYREAFAWALERPYDVIVQMDCDLSHDPAAIPELLDAVAGGAHCAIGSRYVPGGSTPNWPLHRRLLSRYGNRYTSAVLGLSIRDATSGFRAYRREALEAASVDTTRSTGYAFMSEVASRMVAAHLRLVEVPITFVDRAYGTSKMSTRIIVESMGRVTVAGLRGWRGRRRGSAQGPPSHA